jgi:lipoic acid synthetase
MTVDPAYAEVHHLVAGQALHTVCESAKCPNRRECWSRGTATLMLLGEICTRTCRFCAVKSGRPLPLDPDEPRRVAEAVAQMALKHVVLTSVNRDDRADGGSMQFADTIRAIREAVPGITIEVLTPDFEGVEESVANVLEAAPDVFSHNVETVRRFQPTVRPQASYGRSLAVLQQAAAWRPRCVVKSAVMLGLGESDDELYETLTDLVSAGCEVLALGQYLRPTRLHWPVARYVTPDEFARYADKARELGFRAVASGPMVRSSYKAEELFSVACERASAPASPAV